MGGEESYGFMIGTEVRDKDSITATVITIEMALYYQRQGKTLLERLDEIHREFGLYQETLISKYFEGADGVGIMNNMMAGLRQTPPKEIGGIPVISIRDIQDGTTLDMASGAKTKDIDLPASNRTAVLYGGRQHPERQTIWYRAENQVLHLSQGRTGQRSG
jgi:phosphoglucomutase